MLFRDWLPIDLFSFGKKIGWNWIAWEGNLACAAKRQCESNMSTKIHKKIWKLWGCATCHSTKKSSSPFFNFLLKLPAATTASRIFALAGNSARAASFVGHPSSGVLFYFNNPVVLWIIKCGGCRGQKSVGLLYDDDFLFIFISRILLFWEFVALFTSGAIKLKEVFISLNSLN